MHGSRTRRHLSEYTHLEAEMPFFTFEDLLNAIEDLVRDVARRVVQLGGDVLATLNPAFVRFRAPCLLFVLVLFV